MLYHWSNFDFHHSLGKLAYIGGWCYLNIVVVVCNESNASHKSWSSEPSRYVPGRMPHTIKHRLLNSSRRWVEINPSSTHRKDWHLNLAIINSTTLLSHNTGKPIFDRGFFRFVFLWQARYLTKEYLLNDCMKRLVQCQFWRIKGKRIIWLKKF